MESVSVGLLGGMGYGLRDAENTMRWARRKGRDARYRRRGAGDAGHGARHGKRYARDAIRGAYWGERAVHPANPAARSWPSVTSPAATRAVTCGAVMCLHIGLRSRTQAASRAW
jgi:hypothetical protein